MEEYLHNFKGIARGRGLPPLNPMECENFGIIGGDESPQEDCIAQFIGVCSRVKI
jgi:hypothetical protein